VSPAATAVLGYTPEEHYADPDIASKAIYPADRHLLDALVGRGTYGKPVELRWVRKDGAVVSVEHRDTPVRDEHGTIVAVHGIARDVTDRRRNETEQRVLAEMGRVVAGTLDPAEILSRAAEIAAGAIADCCIVYLAAGEGRAGFVRAVLREPADGALRRATEQASSNLDDPPLVGAVLETGLPLLRSELRPRDIALLARTPQDVELLRELRAVSCIGLPLIARGRLAGALALVSSDPQRPYDERDLKLGKELADRISLSVDNSRLYLVAQQAIQARDDLLGVVAHDLRSPLTAVMAAATSIDRKLPRDEAWASIRRASDVIRRSTERANRLIEDLLDVARIETSSLVLESARIEARELLTEVAEAFTLMASEASLRLTTELADAVPPVKADRSRVLQVFSNIVGNAIKFTPAGGTIRVGAMARDGEVLFRVTDSGPGIPADQLPRLFDRFWQAKPGDRRGAGLGLPIARGIVEAHGGRLWVDSAPGRGSTFYFTLPVATDADHRPGEDAPHPPIGPG
jgi:PAS domain S-box-containing protein